MALVAVNLLGQPVATSGASGETAASVRSRRAHARSEPRLDGGSGAAKAAQQHPAKGYGIGIGDTAGARTGKGAGAYEYEDDSADGLAEAVGLDPETRAMLEEILDRKRRAVEQEDYVRAKIYKQLQADLQVTGAALASLQRRKQAAVSREDYDDAAQLKTQIDRIRSEVRIRMEQAEQGPLRSAPAPAAARGGDPGDR